MGRPVLSGRTARPPNDVEDVRSARPYFLAPTPLKTIARRIGSALALVTIDIAGLVLGLFAALAFRSLLFDPKPILWGLLWDHETDWLAFLILLLILVFWQARLYAPREIREGAGPRRAERVPRRGAVARVRDRHRAALHDVRPLHRRRDVRLAADRAVPRELRAGDRDRSCVPPASRAAPRSSATPSCDSIFATLSVRAEAGSTTSSSARCRPARRSRSCSRAPSSTS